MPASFPDGASVLKTIYDGNAEHQIAALWKYLAQGDKASIPEGLLRDQMVLEPKDRPIIYRNFIEGAGPRAIAVGFPDTVHVAWDADQMRLALVWRGAFIDAGIVENTDRLSFESDENLVGAGFGVELQMYKGLGYPTLRNLALRVDVGFPLKDPDFTDVDGTQITFVGTLSF
jgi:hypothetical protein